MPSPEHPLPHSELSSPTSDRGSRTDTSGEVPRLERGGRQADSTLSLKLSELPPRVRSYVLNLEAQFLDILRTHKVRSLEELEENLTLRRSKKELTHSQCLSILESVHKLLKQFREASQTGKLPEGAHTEILKIQLQEARDLLGPDHVFGPEQVQQAWNIDLDPNDIPGIPYSTEDLEKAKQLGEILILRINTDGEGHPLTIHRLQELTDPLLEEQGQGTSIYPYDWHKTDPLIITETPSLKWALISPDLLPNTTDKNYLEQTLSLKDYLKQHHLLTEEEESELDDKTIKTLKKQISSDTDWKQAAQTLSNLKINQHHRRSAPEAVYDTLLRFLITGERPLPDRYDWTRSRSLGGRLVSVGRLGPDGLDVSGRDPQRRYGFLGVGLSR